MQRDLLELQAVADASEETRAAATSGYDAGADYVESQLAASGLRVWREPFTFHWEDYAATLQVASAGGPGYEPDVRMAGTYSTPEPGVKGRVVVPPDGQGCTVESWNGVPLAGRIVMFRQAEPSPGCWTETQMRTAQRLGAVAAVALPAALPSFEVDDFPMLYLRDRADGEALWARVSAGEDLVATVHTRYREEMRRSYNVLAETPGDGPVIMVGAHLDSVPSGPGMDDNASGAVAVLELARRAGAAQLPGRLRFAWWGAEEYGMVGSTHHLQALWSADPSSLRMIRAYLNADMLGSPNYVHALYSPEIGGGSAQSRLIHSALSQYFRQAQRPVLTLRPEDDGFSDHMPFKACGLAFGGVSSFIPGRGEVGKSAEEQRLFGGSAGQPYSPHYHSARDRLEHVSMGALDPLSRALAYATARLALAPPEAMAAPACRPGERRERIQRHRADLMSGESGSHH